MRRQTLKQPKEAHDPATFVRVSVAESNKSHPPRASPPLRAPRLRRAVGPLFRLAVPHKASVCVRWREGLARPPNISPRCRTPTAARHREGLLGPADGLRISTPSGFTPDSPLLGRLCPLLWAKQKKWEGALDSFQKEKKKRRRRKLCSSGLFRLASC